MMIVYMFEHKLLLQSDFNVTEALLTDFINLIYTMNLKTNDRDRSLPHAHERHGREK